MAHATELSIQQLSTVPTGYGTHSRFGITQALPKLPILGGSQQDTTPSVAQWNWSNVTFPSGKIFPQPNSYATGLPTKTGLMPADLQNFIGVPLVIVGGASPCALDGQALINIIRQAEDWVETNSGVLLSQSWVASPPVVNPQEIAATGTAVTTASGQVQGIDYDVLDIGYDFFYRRFLAQGWGITQMRYRPLLSVVNMSFIYPLLSEFFVIPLSWVVEDRDAAMVRLVPSANTQMLPLFAMQLAFMGFAESLPQAMWFQYLAGLTPVDYATRFQFVYPLVLSAASLIALRTIQGSINAGAVKRQISVDGLSQSIAYPSSGQAYGGLITAFQNQVDQYMRTMTDLVRGTLTFVSL